DDERANRDLLKVMLAPEGLLLLTASSGEEALALLAHQPPDLILLDVMMPGMDGYEVAGKIKGNPDTSSVPIIMVTAMDDHKARLLGLSAGVEDFLTKPVDRAELRVRVKNLLNLKMYGDKLRATLADLESANESLDRHTREIEAAQTVAGAATARLARLQKITAALGSTVTQDEVADSVLREAIIALECEAGAVVIKSEESGELTLLRESGSLDSFMRSFKDVRPPRSRGPYARAVEKCRPLYLESFEEMVTQYPAFQNVAKTDSRGAWIFLPLEINREAVGALAFGFSGPRKFSILDRQFADTVSRYCAQALDRVRLRIAAAAAIDEASEARMMAEHANNAKTVFLRAMSHELRTPLNAISGYTEILELGIRGVINPDQLKDLGRIKRAAAYLLRLINDVLTIARLEGARPLNVISIPVNPVLNEVEGLCVLQAKANGLTLTVKPADEEIRVAADAERFQQILLNLITNAIKFTPTGGAITVTCESDATVARMSVTDTGVGVRLIDIERVFEPFVQIDRHLTTATQQGVGLGLSISRELARAMRGDLTLNSTEGIGSTFTLTLPIASEIPLAPQLEVSEPASGIRPMRAAVGS
ncbi:MAG TPA: hybrid sensor histidine kinase/response regulator, partial [Gemmatimonadaceae bacterium]|nr:hybrid sensor histidine kinase/response regulator [Gemmatimonadaceae bacterium]